jgi:hypothetical protein
MQSVQRHFGRYMKRSADEKQVSVLLKDFEEADHLLTRVRPAIEWLNRKTLTHDRLSTLRKHGKRPG